MHSESYATYQILGSYNGVDNPMIDINGADLLRMNFPAGGGLISISNSKNVSIIRGSDVDVPFYCNIKASQIVSPYISIEDGTYASNAVINTSSIECDTNDFIVGTGAISSKGNLSFGDSTISSDKYFIRLGDRVLQKVQKPNLLVTTDGYVTRF